MRILFALALLLPFEATASPLYFCKAYSGGTFWSSTHCNQHRALIERIVSVPLGLPFEQQVQLAEQARAQGAALAAVPNVAHSVTTQANGRPDCSAVQAQIASIDSMARQPLPAPQHDRLRESKRQLREQTARMRC